MESFDVSSILAGRLQGYWEQGPVNDPELLAINALSKLGDPPTPYRRWFWDPDKDYFYSTIDNLPK